jgi:hypothetical protein
MTHHFVYRIVSIGNGSIYKVADTGTVYVERWVPSIINPGSEVRVWCLAKRQSRNAQRARAEARRIGFPTTEGRS